MVRTEEPGRFSDGRAHAGDCAAWSGSHCRDRGDNEAVDKDCTGDDGGNNDGGSSDGGGDGDNSGGNDAGDKHGGHNDDAGDDNGVRRQRNSRGTRGLSVRISFS